MSSPKIIVLLVVSLLMMQVNLSLAQSVTITVTITFGKKSKSNALQFGIPGTGLAGYIVPINLGTPRAGAQPTYNMLIDTGRSDLWVVDDICRDIYCVGRTNKVNYNRLSTFSFLNTGKSVSLGYSFNRYQVSGTTGKEQLTFGGQTVFNQDFIRVSSTKGFSSADAYDGIIGLAPGKNIPNRASMIEKMFENGLISSKTFTIHQGGTVLDIGDVPAVRGPINYVNVVNKGTWNFRASLVALDEGSGAPITVAKNAVFQIETLVPNIGVPTSSLKTITARLGARLNPATGLYNIACTVSTILVLTINGQRYEIPPTSYINPNPAVAPCTLNLIQTQNWILGQSFLALFDTVYNADLNQIGFA